VQAAAAQPRRRTRDQLELDALNKYIPHSSAKGIVLMFHGYTACKASVLAEAKSFHDLGFATLLVDFRGSGGSSGCDTSIGMLEAEDVARTADHCCQHVDLA
jgi:alpha/beta superfamily hydrolase